MKCVNLQYYVLLLLVIVLQYIPKEQINIEQSMKAICEYETLYLCPDCFTSSRNCDAIDKLFVLHKGSWFNIVNNIFNSHTARKGNFLHSRLAIAKRINRDNAIEKLLLEFCKSLSPPPLNCRWSQGGSTEQAKKFLEKSILQNNRIEGCIFCPISSKLQTLHRFLKSINQNTNELFNLLAIRTNVEPVLLNLLSNEEEPFPVPKLFYSYGFSFIESYDGQSLDHFYEHSILTRMLIASKLIKAALMFTEGVDGFRLYLTDVNSDNVMVRLEGDNKNVFISIVDLDNVLIMDSRADSHDTEHMYHAHRRIDCKECFAYVQQDVCTYQSSDLNLYAICQLLLENRNGNYPEGLLHNGRVDSKLVSDQLRDSQTLHNLLEECVYCHPPGCRNRTIILNDVLDIISEHVDQ
ncbi:uncharacterized protein LOC128730527 [Anopheles nili]|uniref:uncharacterized protein LOC128730527 n=1 Tax=Anopheles nili TaxID=185578 RepID=UPI00237C51C9|nr:uncharacterized protein LOC128730527 [Anopheles nili]